MQSAVKKFFDQAIEVIFPSKCLICASWSNKGILICSSCWQKIEFITDPKCEICGYPFGFDSGKGSLCAPCHQNNPYFDKAFTIFKYSAVSKSLIFKLKYNDQLHIAYFFAQLIANKLQNFYEYRFIVPVPLHPRRIRERLYNQSAILGSHVAKLARLEFLPSILSKKRYDVPQSQLSRDRRKKNVLNSFVIAEDYINCIKGKNIILIDDVYTTGSTVNECSKVLKKAGCNKILVVTIARTVI
ncbi:MAG: ComF family protein [Rickettsiales bacterium]|nr:ComF family protein [Rickettsiales bacterium]